MPKSRRTRNGRPRRTARTSRPRQPPADGTQPGAPGLSEMLRADALEAAGDAVGALRVLEGMPTGPDGRLFWRPERVRRLRQLVTLGEEAPDWVWSRWVVSQAAQSTPGQPARAVELAVRTRGGPSTLWGTDETDAECKVIDHDWVYRQLVLHEYGGLATFLRTRAGRALLSRASGVGTWVGVPMGGYELVSEAADEITWRDLAADRLVHTLNLGAVALCATGECVVGRVVESGGVALFESAPLCVPPEVAARVADAPADWLAAVGDGCRGLLGPLMSVLVARMHRFDLLCDLPSDLRRQLVQPGDPALRADRVGVGGNGRQYDVAVTLAALAGELDVEGDASCDCGQCDLGRPTAPLVAAALLEPGTAEALAGLLVPTDALGLAWLADVLAPPAGVVCRRLVAGLTDAA